MAIMNNTEGKIKAFVALTSGFNQDANLNSSRTMKYRLLLSALLGGFYIFLFLWFRHRCPQVYHPKAYLGRRHEKTEIPSRNPLHVLQRMFQTPDQEVIRSCGLDAFFYLRYIQFLCGLFLILSFIVMPILIPINYMGGKRQSKFSPGNNTNSTGNSTNSTWSNDNLTWYDGNLTWYNGNLTGFNGNWTGFNGNWTGYNGNLTGNGTTNGTIKKPEITDFLDSISFRDIDTKHSNFYWAHFVVAVLVVAVVCYAFLNELKYFVQIRQAWLRPYDRLDKRSSGTILVTGIPSDLLNDRDLRRYFAGFHGGVEYVWINRDVRELTRKISERTRLIKLLEKWETKLVLKANKVAGKARKAQGQETGPSEQMQTENTEEGQSIQNDVTGSPTHLQPPAYWPVFEAPEPAADGLDLSEVSSAEGAPPSYHSENQRFEPIPQKWRTWLRKKDRPIVRVCHTRNWFIRRLPFLGQLLGRREDGISYCRHEIDRLNREIEEMRKSTLPPLNSAFIRFKTRSGAHLATAARHSPAAMKILAFEPSPEDVIWSNLVPGYFSRRSLKIINIILVSALILLYSIPVAFAGLLSQYDNTLLSVSYFIPRLNPFREWLRNSTILFILIGTIWPTLILLGTRLLIPLALYSLAIKQGAPTQAHVQLMMQNGLFAFLFVQIFLIGSISASSIISFTKAATIEMASDPAKAFDSPTLNMMIPKILASDLPNSMNFFIWFLIFGCVSTGGDEIGQVVNGFFMYWHWLRTMVGKTRTPRQIYKHQHFVPRVYLGISFPLMTLYACIVLAFSIIQPAILGIGFLGFGLLWIGSGYALLYVKRNAGGTNGTNGQFFIQAMNQTFLGLYVMEICMLGLFAKLGLDSIPTPKQDTSNFNFTRQGNWTEDANRTVRLFDEFGRPIGNFIDSGNNTIYHSAQTLGGGPSKAHIWQGVLMSLVIVMTLIFHYLVNRWLNRVGMGLHAPSDRKYEDLGIEEEPNSEHEQNPGGLPIPSIQIENVSVEENGNVPIDETEKTMQQEPAANPKDLKKRREGAGEGEKEGSDDDAGAKGYGEDDYKPNVLREEACRQQVLWLPDDGEEVGVGRDEARLCQEAGVSAVFGGANVIIEPKRRTWRKWIGRSGEEIRAGIVVDGIPIVVEPGYQFFMSELTFAGLGTT